MLYVFAWSRNLSDKVLHTLSDCALGVRQPPNRKPSPPHMEN